MTKIDNKTIWEVMEIVEASKEQPEILNGYPEEFRKLVTILNAVGKVRRETIEDLETEIAELYSEVIDLGKALDDKDLEGQTAYLKLKAALIQKIVDLKERIYNMKSIRAFQSKVLTAVDQVMSPDQRTAFMKILEQ